MSQELENIIGLYRGTLLRNLNLVKEILNGHPENQKTFEAFENLLNKSQEHLIEKWRTGKKYLRTVSASRAISNYPKEVAELSLTLDATVNILDDLLDETLSKEAKGLYIVEIIRLMSNFVQLDFKKDMRSTIDSYYHKLISIAILEQVYYTGIKSSITGDVLNMDNVLRNAKEVFNVRSTDMDIFLEIPLEHIGMEKRNINEVVRLGRIFRSLNLIKKDLDDYEHDSSMEIDTVYTILSKNRIVLEEAVKWLVKSYVEDLKTFDTKPDLQNLMDMIYKEKELVLEKLETFVSKNNL